MAVAKSTVTEWAESLPAAELAYKVKLVKQGSLWFTAAQKAALLSGGNAQKLVLAREFGKSPTLVLAHSPSRGLDVRGVMGYEGHLMLVPDADDRRKQVEECMAKLLAAHSDVGGEIVSAGGTGTYAVNTWANEVQAGSYVLMDTAYGAVADLPFEQALTVLGTVI